MLLLLLFLLFLFLFLPLVLRSQESLKLTKQYKGGYDRQSVLSAAGKLSCNKTALSAAPKQKSFEIDSWSL